MVNLARLSTEILTDPDTRGYGAMSDADVQAKLRARRYADVHIIRATEVLPIEYLSLPDDAKTIVNRVLANGGTVPVERKAVRRRLREVFGGVDERAANDDVVLVRQYTSVAEELGIGQDVTVTDIQTVRAG